MSNQTNYYWRHREKVLEQAKVHRKNRRLKVLSHYSNGEPECACCGEREYEFLCIDHLKGGGFKHRKIIGANIDRWLIRNNFPEGFRVLCQNCNFAKGLYGECPHNISCW